MPCSGVSYGGSGLICVITGGEELMALVKGAARVREQARGGGGMVAELTAITKRGSACSGTAGVPRIWATATGRSEVGDETGEDVRGFWRGVAR